jgi:hypothetical protein
MKTPKLCQVLAIEKGVKSRTASTVTGLYHKVQKGVLLNGLSKTYEPLNEDGVRYPPERQRVQVRADEVLRETQKALTELFDVTAQKDFANCAAKADITVDGQVVLSGVPVTYLLFLEKQLTDLKTLLSKIPTLDSAEDWSYDTAAGLFKSAPVVSTRTQKVQKPIVLYDATEEHPAQTQLISEDIVVGNWTTVKQSGALPADRKRTLRQRVEKLLESVKFAREAANSEEAEKVEVGAKVLNFVFGA